MEIRKGGPRWDRLREHQLNCCLRNYFFEPPELPPPWNPPLELMDDIEEEADELAPELREEPDELPPQPLAPLERATGCDPELPCIGLKEGAGTPDAVRKPPFDAAECAICIRAAWKAAGEETRAATGGFVGFTGTTGFVPGGLTPYEGTPTTGA